MQYTAVEKKVDEIKTDCLVVVVEEHGLSKEASVVDALLGGALQKALSEGDIKAKAGVCFLLPTTGDALPAARVLVLGLGESKKRTVKQLTEAMQSALTAVLATAARSVHFAFGDVSAKGCENLQHLLIQSVASACYRGVGAWKSTPAEEVMLSEVSFDVPSADADPMDCAASQAVAAGVTYCKDLANMPSNVCTPSRLAEEAVYLSDQYPAIRTEVIEETEARALGMGAFLAVGQGSHEPSKFILMHYEGQKTSDAPYVLVGKGVTFDTGGISLKPGAGLEGMKYDMGGAAGVFGVMKAIAQMKLPLNVIGCVPSVENMPGSRAYKPGDLLTSLSGKTIEVTNTDAEGRLILCDALTYVERFKPRAVIDVATLTGACLVALGQPYSGLMSTDDDLADALLEAGRQSHDLAWRLPVDEYYQSMLDSPYADLQNAVEGRMAGAITAACFLSRFTEAYPWAHLDIAGSAGGVFNKKVGATGRPVNLLVRYLVNQLG